MAPIGPCLNATTGSDNETSNCTNMTSLPDSYMDLNAVVKNPLLTVIGVIGALANALVVTVLFRGGKEFSAIMRKLLMHQAVIDGLICLLIIIQGYMTTPTHIYEIDLVVCYIISNQHMYWLCAFLSAQGLVCLAGERFVAICKPFTYIRYKDSTRVFTSLLICVYLYAVIICVPSFLLHTEYENGICKSFAEVDFDTNAYYRIHPYIWLTTYYLVPITMSIILYSNILKALRESKLLDKSTKSITTDRASSQLTKTAITVTVLFTIFIGIDSIAYVLQTFDLVVIDEYLLITILFCTCSNSFCNPFVYVVLMPYFRKSLRSTFSCFRIRSDPETTPQTQQSESTEVTSRF